VTTRGRVALKVVVWAVALAPLAGLVYGFATDNLTVNPIEYVTRELGQTTIRLLLATLALTPLRLLFGWSWPITLRRLLGLFAFSYAVLHFSVWIVLDHFFDWRTMGDDILKRPWITVGVAALCTSGTRIVAGSSATSVLYLRMTGGSCGAMPPSGILPAATTNIVRDWIDNGAINN